MSYDLIDHCRLPGSSSSRVKRPTWRRLAFDGVPRRLIAFYGDLGLEDLFQERSEAQDQDHFESNEGDADDEMGSTSTFHLDPALWEEEDDDERLKREIEEKKREEQERKRKEEEQVWRRKKHDSFIKSIHKYDPKVKHLVWTRFSFGQFSFDMDEECKSKSMRS